MHTMQQSLNIQLRAANAAQGATQTSQSRKDLIITHSSMPAHVRMHHAAWVLQRLQLDHLIAIP